MRIRWLAIVAVLAFASAARAGEPIDLKILYAGNPGSDREQDFKTFLAESFTRVRTTDYEKFTEGQAKGYDVVIFDWTSIYPRDEQGKVKEGPITKLNAPSPPKLGESYGRPTILIGAAGGYVIRPLRLKINWLCQCLDDAAHGLATSHEVFQQPLKVDFRFDDRAVPPGYRRWPGGDELGPTIKVWKVQNRMFPAIDPGMVSDPYGFADSPDAEVISSGINGKGPDSVALGRHGNFFLWGFAASPADMTPEARKCFVNAVCYIKKFDGQQPYVRKTAMGRGWALLDARLAKEYFDADFFKRAVPEVLRRRFGKDSAKYLQYYTENFEYLRPSGEGLAVDEDVKGLGLSNRKVELLDACVSKLERGDRPELARRILARYTTENFTDAKGWRTWLEASRRRLFFTDTGGFKFLVAPESLIGPAGRGQSVRLADDTTLKPDASNPVVARSELSPATVRRGGDAVLIVRIETAPSWHIYAVEGSAGPGIATTLRLSLPRGVEAAGEWSCPKPIQTSDGQMAYEGKLEFRHKLRIGADVADGPIEVGCELGYQACDLRSCRAPTRANLAAKAEVVGPATGR